MTSLVPGSRGAGAGGAEPEPVGARAARGCRHGGPQQQWQQEARDPGWPGPPAHAPQGFPNWSTLQGGLKFSAPSQGERSPSALGTKAGSGTAGATCCCATFLGGAKAGSGVSSTPPGSAVYPWRAGHSSHLPQLQPGSGMRGPAGGVCRGCAEASSSNLRLHPGSDIPRAVGDVCPRPAKAAPSHPGAQAGSDV